MPVLAVIGEGLVELELETAAGDLRLAAGGDAANVAVMAARLGAAVRLGGRIGADPLGTWLRSFWRDAGVDVDHVLPDPDAPTGLYLNVLTGEGDHRFVYWRTGSAGSRLRAGDLVEAFLADVAMLVVTGVTLAASRSSAEAARRAIARARAGGARIACVLNYRPALGGDAAELASLARAADIVIGSREDADAVLGERDPERLARGPLPVPELVLTDGGEPVAAVVEGTLLTQPVPDVDVVDAAGAGDAFAGAYLAERIAGGSPTDALAWGVAASARSVTRRGCAGSYPMRTEVRALAHRLRAAA